MTLSGKKENRKMMDVLERMKMVRKVDDLPEEADVLTQEQEQAVSAEIEAAFVTPAPSMSAISAPVADVPAVTPPAVYNFATAPKRDSASEKSFWDDATPTGPDLNRFMSISELYHSFLLKTNGTDTVYLIEEYMKTLPETLPAELRRSIIVRIMTASGFDFDKLLNDGIDRISRLNDYADKFASHTEEVIARQNQEIAELEARIATVREDVENRKNLHKQQFLAIESEAQRLKEILDFVTK